MADRLMLRLILLHPKSMPDESIAEWLVFVQRDVGEAATVTTGRDDFMANMKRCGGPMAWARSVAERFDGGIIPTSTGAVGRFTADICEGFLARGKPVSQVDARGVATRVGRITRTTGKSVDGWTVSP